MERMIQLQIEHLPEGVYLATSDDIQGLIAQGNTLQSTIEIAQSDSYSFGLPLMSGGSFNYPMVVGV
jgi:hypothetical protein